MLIIAGGILLAFGIMAALRYLPQIAVVLAILYLIGRCTGPAHAESLMAPIDDHGRTIIDLPFAPRTEAEEIERLRALSTARCLDTTYTLVRRSGGLVCVRPVQERSKIGLPPP
jgi:hypothetical protein